MLSVFSSFCSLTIRAGLPTTTAPAGTSSVTIDPAPTTAPLPIRTPSKTTALAPIKTSSSKITGVALGG